MLSAGMLRMYATRCNDRIVAVFYGYAFQGTVYYYLSGYDPGELYQPRGPRHRAGDRHSATIRLPRGARTSTRGATRSDEQRRQLFPG
jgi:hypothetical protein